MSSLETVTGRVSCHDLRKIFVTSERITTALEDCSLEVSQGEFLCIVGPSGCGKSTLLRILGELDYPSSGSVEASSKVRPAFVFQDTGVFPWLNVLDNVAFGLRMAGKKRSERERIAQDWVTRVGLGQFETSYPGRLSGGMRQRVAIARAFASGSDLLLMDEPLGALDAQTRALMQEQLLDLWERSNTTVVLVTHSIEEALLLGDRVVTMTSRPGTIKAIYDIPFERPRSREIERSPVFADLSLRLWDDLRDEVETSLNSTQGLHQ